MSGKNVDNFLDTMVYGEVGDWTLLQMAMKEIKEELNPISA